MKLGWILNCFDKGLDSESNSFALNEFSFMRAKRAQATLFIVIAILIVSAVLVYFYFISPKGYSPFETQTSFEGCMQSAVEESIEILGKQAGFANPEFYYLHKGDKVGYLCYTDEYYQPCLVQKPFLKQHFEKELMSSTQDEIYSCYESYLSELKSKGYSVTEGDKELNISILPEKVLVELNAPITMGKEGSSRTTKFISVLDSRLYNILMISNSILQYETNYGDIDTTEFMNFYPEVVIDKLKQSEGATVYIVKDLKTGSAFQFASRSYAMPAGYGV